MLGVSVSCFFDVVVVFVVVFVFFVLAFVCVMCPGQGFRVQG